jgi:hypothetical protein
MATNKYNRGMPIIKRHTPGGGDAPIQLKAARQQADVTQIADYRERQGQSRVRAINIKVHTFFWTLAS